MSVPAKNLRIDQLKLDLLNPRIGKASDQREAMQQIIVDQDYKLANLVENIVDNNSLNPMDRLLVMKDEDGKYVVLEGNRCTLALKLLANPAALTGLDVRPALQKRMEAAAARFDKGAIEPIACFEVISRADSSTWIEQRHRSEDEGRGIVGWSAEAIARFTGRDPALQALDFVRQHAELTEEEKAVLSSKFPITTLDRLLSTPAVREKIGFEIREDKLFTALPADEAIKPLKRIVLDLAQKTINVTGLKKVDQQIKYVSSLAPEDMPDFSKREDITRAVEGITQSQFTQTPAPEPRAKPARAQRLPERLVLVPRACRLNVTNNNTLEIYRELSGLKLKQFPNAIAVLLRVFMENSVDHYIEASGGSLKFVPPNGSRESYKNLDTKVKEAVNLMVLAGMDRKYFDGVTRTLSDKKASTLD